MRFEVSGSVTAAEVRAAYADVVEHWRPLLGEPLDAVAYRRAEKRVGSLEALLREVQCQAREIEVRLDELGLRAPRERPELRVVEGKKEVQS